MKDKLNGAFLLLALILSNCTYDTVGKQFNKFIIDNYIARLFIVYMLIFLTIHFTSDYPNHLEHFQRTALIFLIYLMATKTGLKILIIVIFLIIINHLLNHHIEYLENNKKDKSQEYVDLNYYSTLLTKLIVVIVICGFSYEIYIRSRNKNFSFFKYITTQS